LLVSYCSRQCQRLDWHRGFHATDCSERKPATSQAGLAATAGSGQRYDPYLLKTASDLRLSVGNPGALQSLPKHCSEPADAGHKWQLCDLGPRHEPRFSPSLAQSQCTAQRVFHTRGLRYIGLLACVL
jgi:hypothetical protein